ncbi:MAG: hydantoinase/oxoprolinase family protein [Chloroflexota bacterium]
MSEYEAATLVQPGGDNANVRYRLGADIGGTFTDVVIVGDDGSVATRKVLSSPDDYGLAILRALSDLARVNGLSGASIHEVIHGTTICTNAILEGKGARTGLITTRGFRDTLEIGRMRYPRLYDLAWNKPIPLVERRRRLEVVERLDRDGEIVEPLDEQSARVAIRRLLDEHIESLAVCLLHSYANGAPERQVRQIAEELAPGLLVSLSSEVLPEIGEYERTSTTVINAYLQPVVARYLGALEASLAAAGVSAGLWVMQSNGGVMSAAAASERPIHIVESGPAAGVIAALGLARDMQLSEVIALDMGGTTAKASIIEGGQLHRTAEYEVGAGLNVGNRLNTGAGYRLRVPAIDIAEVGAGGGSLVWIDIAGAVHVGPQSAGAQPGPVCYGAGGTEPTLTDANLLLGYLNPEALLGGQLRVDAKLAKRVFQERVASPLGLNVLEAAYGVHRIAVANMVRAVKTISSERGRDPRGFTFVAYGGNGPLHGVPAAAELGAECVVVPPWPGLFSAFGLLCAEPSHHVSRSLWSSTRRLGPAALEAAYRELEGRARDALAREGYADRDITLMRVADVRYAGQSFELRLGMPTPVSTAALDDLDERFAREHERTYGHRSDGDPIELVHIRAEARVPRADGPPIVYLPNGHSSSQRQSKQQWRRAFFGPRLGELTAPVLTRAEIGPQPLEGPMIVEEYDATTVVPPGCTIARDSRSNLVITVRSAGGIA